MAFLLGLVGTVILVVLIGTIGLAVFTAIAVYYLVLIAGIVFLLSLRLIFEGFDTGNYGMGFGGLALFLVAGGLVFRFFQKAYASGDKQ